MIKFLIQRPIATIVVFFALAVLGVATIGSIPIGLLPDVEIPEITVYALHEDYTAREMQDHVAQRLNEQFRQCQNVDDIYTESADGKATLKIRFDFGTDISYAAMEVNEQIDKALVWLPREMERPRVVKANVSDIPVFYLNVAYGNNKQLQKGNDDFVELSRLTERAFKKRIEFIPEVAFVDMSGLEQARVTIKPDRLKMKALGLTMGDIENAFQQNNVQYGNINVNQGIYHYNVRIESKLETRRDIENILIKTRNMMPQGQFANSDRIIAVKDIAEVAVQKQVSDGLFLSNHKQAISLAIVKQPKAKIEDLKENVDKVLEVLRAENKNIEFTLSQDQTLLLNESIDNLKYNLLIGALLAIVVVFLFYSSFKEPLLIGLSIPLSLIISLFLFWLCGLSINIVSLSGLILAIGMMIDNAIIVIDNINQSWIREQNLLKGGINGTNQVIVPMLSSMLTTVAIFVPLVFISGVAGGLFADNALAVSLGLAVSFWVSIVLLPVIHHSLFKRADKKKIVYSQDKLKRNIAYNVLLRFYNAGFAFVFRNRTVSLVFALLLLCGGFLAFIHNEKKSFPVLPEKEFFVFVDWNEGVSPVAVKDRIVKLFYGFDDRIKNVNCWVGVQDYSLSTEFDLSPTQAKLYFEVENPSCLHEISEAVVHTLKTNYPLIDVETEESANVFNQVFKTKENEVELRVFTNTVTLDADSVAQIFSHFSDLSVIASEDKSIPCSEYFSVELLNDRILLYDLSVNQIVNILLSAFDNFKIGTLNTSSYSTPVLIGTERETIEAFINNYIIDVVPEKSIPLKELVRIRTKKSTRIITSNSKGEYIAYPLNEELGVGNLARTIRKRMVNDFTGTMFSVEGNFVKTKALINTLLMVLTISIVLLYFILAAQFESLLLPFIVLIEIPIDIGFALLVLYFAGYSINIMAIIGIIVATGIVINDSILKIDTINNLRKTTNLSLKDAIHTGGERRLKSIVMTSLTTIFAIVPALFSSSFGAALQKPFAIAIVACLGFGTLVSLFGLPLFYWMLANLSTKSNK